MLHFEYQIIVKGSKEGEMVDMIKIYGIAVSYQKKVGLIYKLTMKHKEHKIRDAINVVTDETLRT